MAQDEMRGRAAGLRRLVAVGVGAFAVGVVATVYADAESSDFEEHEVLTAAKLNAKFDAVAARLAELESREPFAGTAPGVWGQEAARWACGPAPDALNLDVVESSGETPSVLSHALGEVAFTNGGSLNAGPPVHPACTSGLDICARPLTFFLVSPADKQISIHAYLDDAGAVYVNGAKQEVEAAVNGISVTFNTFANEPFTLSFLACSNNGVSLDFEIFEAFIVNNDLQVDYDATFHRTPRAR